MNDYEEIATNAMKAVWGRTPRGYQSYIIPYLLHMLSGNISLDPVLLVQSTGSGKSMVPLTCAVVDGGVTIIIENTLALGADQVNKVKQSNLLPNKKVISFQLDMIKSELDEKDLSTTILQHLSSNIDTSIILYTSPETLLKDVWTELLSSLIENNLLCLFCIDKIHLFVDYGISFCLQFQKLKSLILGKMTNQNGLFKVPLLMMIATFDKYLLDIAQRMLGFNVSSYNKCWGPSISFQKRHIYIKIRYSIQQFKIISDEINTSSKRNYNVKSIVICSTAKKAIAFQTNSIRGLIVMMKFLVILYWLLEDINLNLNMHTLPLLQIHILKQNNHIHQINYL